MEKHKKILEEIVQVKKELDEGKDVQKPATKTPAFSADDDLDDYMERLAKVSAASNNEKFARKQLRAKLLELEAYEKRLRKMINIAKPTELPPLKPPMAQTGLTSKLMIGSIRGKGSGGVKKPIKLPTSSFAIPEDNAGQIAETENVEEFDEDEIPEPKLTAEKKEISVPVMEPAKKETIGDVKPENKKEIASEAQSAEDSEKKKPVTEKPAPEKEKRAKKRPETSQPEVPPAKTPRVVGPGPPPPPVEEKKKAIPVSAEKKPCVKGTTEENERCEYDTSREDYETWVPPVDQSGDGKTDLNKKFGY